MPFVFIYLLSINHIFVYIIHFFLHQESVFCLPALHCCYCFIFFLPLPNWYLHSALFPIITINAGHIFYKNYLNQRKIKSRKLRPSGWPRILATTRSISLYLQNLQFLLTPQVSRELFSLQGAQGRYHKVWRGFCFCIQPSLLTEVIVFFTYLKDPRTIILSFE